MTRRSRNRNPSAWPTSIQELDAAEHFLVWAFRRWAMASSGDINEEHACRHMNFVWNAFEKRFGADDSDTALIGFLAIIHAIQEYARRSVRHHRPCCPCLGSDEVWLICLVGCCQRGDSRRARFLAEQVVRSEGVGDLLDGAWHLGRAMWAHALALPHRTGEFGPAANAAVTIH